MDAKITGYHRDLEDHWVAELDCGHNQHVRHNPPMESRPWVTSADGRNQFLGQKLNCILCDERENGSGGKVMGLYLGAVGKYHGPRPVSDSEKELSKGNWIDVQLGDDLPVKDRVWESAIGKQAVVGPVRVGKFGAEGDQQADTKNHGGIDKAICLYPKEHYKGWEEQLQLRLCGSAFGENISSEGLLEKAVCVGDQFSVGSVVLEISQPRQPCWKIATRWGYPTLAKEFLKQAKTGWYFRVLQPGTISAEDFINLEHRPNPDWTVQRVIRARFDKAENEDRIRLQDISELAASWKK